MALGELQYSPCISYSLSLSVAVLKRVDSGIPVLWLDYSVPGFHGSGENVERATPVQ